MTDNLIREVLGCRTETEMLKYELFANSIGNEKLQGAIYVMKKFLPLIETVISQYNDNPNIINVSLLNHINNLK
jgi:hypothetical protein